MPITRQLPDEIRNPRFDFSRLFVPRLEDLIRAFGHKIASDIMSRVKKTKVKEKPPLSNSVIYFIFENSPVRRSNLLSQYTPSKRGEVGQTLQKLEREGKIRKVAIKNDTKYVFCKFN